VDGVNGFADETLLWSGNTHPRTHGAALSRPEPLDSHTGIRIGRTRFNYEVEIATTASAPDRHSPEFGQHIRGKFDKRARRLCGVTYLLDDDICPSNPPMCCGALGTRINRQRRQKQWPVPILPWHQRYTEFVLAFMFDPG
jgi:hypothetical protein